MKAHLAKLWESRSPRERLVLVILAAVVVVAVYLAFVQSAYQARAQLGKSVSVLEAQSLQLERDAAELARARAAPVPAAGASDLRTQLQAQVAAAGLAQALLRLDVQEENRVQAVFGSVPFADWLSWVSALQAQHIRLSIGRIEALSTPGLVSVTATFVRAKP